MCKIGRKTLPKFWKCFLRSGHNLSIQKMSHFPRTKASRATVLLSVYGSSFSSFVPSAGTLRTLNRPNRPRKNDREFVKKIWHFWRPRARKTMDSISPGPGVLHNIVPIVRPGYFAFMALSRTNYTFQRLSRCFVLLSCLSSVPTCPSTSRLLRDFGSAACPRLRS